MAPTTSGLYMFLPFGVIGRSHDRSSIQIADQDALVVKVQAAAFSPANLNSRTIN